ncbi:MAG: TonB-dependent receptor [Burkholderiaceae bacterium]
MKTKLTPIAAATAVALAGALAAPAYAQSAAAPAPAASAAREKEAVQTVEVTGIRASMQQSLNQKRNAETHVEVITAEDVGKLPDKNVADSLQRLPGVTISSAGANEGGFDESDRVSMRGTNPSYTQTLVNGHNVASGDWFALDQTSTGAVGRSVSYTLLPSEVVGSVVVHKSSEADLVEGGVVGSVDIITRKPLEFKKPFSMAVSLGGVYADLPKKTDPQANVLMNFRNEAGTFGVLGQVFFEKRHLRRDGVEELGYEQIKAGSPVAISNPDLANVWYPTAIGAALFEQERTRKGGLLDFQFKPNNNVSLDLNGFYSKLEASNYNRNYLLWNTHFINQGGTVANPGQAPDPGYVVSTQNGVSTLTSATFANNGAQHGIYDMISRPGEGATTQYLDLDGDFRISDALKLSAKVGTSKGLGVTPRQNVLEADIIHTGGAYQLNGVNNAASFSLPGVTPSAAPTSANYGLDWIFGANNVKVKDSEAWQQIDGDYSADAGILASIKFGARTNQHKRDALGAVNAGAKGGWDPSTWPTPVSNYPNNFGKGLGGSVPANIWYFTPAQLADFDAQYQNLGDGSTNSPTSRNYPGFDYSVHETTTAGYVMANFEGNKWSGNLGLRLVRTTESVLFYTSGSGDPNSPRPSAGAIDSAWGWWLPQAVNHSYTDPLPSANFRFELSKDLIARVAASRTMTRADYTALAGSASLSPPATDTGIGSGSAGNPDLKPITSNNLDGTLEWYFADRALLSASLFYMDLTNYVSLGHTTGVYQTQTHDHPLGTPITYTLTTPVNSSAKVHGVELAYQQPIWGGLGAEANLTALSYSTADGEALVGASKLTYNLSGYYENDLFSARLGWNHRSKFYSGLDRQTAFSQAAVGALSASLNFNITKQFAVHFDARNLNNPKLKYYAKNEQQPRAIYSNGRQYYVSASYEFK